MDSPCPGTAAMPKRAATSCALTLPAACDDEDAVQAVLTGFLLTVCSLRDNYPEYIEVMEV